MQSRDSPSSSFLAHSYWHQQMQTVFDEASSVFQFRPLIEELEVSSWIEQTPLHIATIYGNAAGIQFLLSYRVSTTKRDIFGQLPVDYLSYLHPHLLLLFTFPHAQQFDLKSLLTPLLEKWQVNLKEQTQRLSDPLPLENLAIACPIREKKLDPIKTQLAGKPFYQGLTFQHTFQNMEVIAKQIGLTLHTTNQFSFVRDYFLRLADNSVWQPYSSAFLDKAIARTHSSNLYLRRIGASFTSNPFFSGWSGKTASSLASLDPSLLSAKQFLYTYLEGGNVFIAHNQSGEQVALVGADHLLHTLHLLDLEKRDWQELAAIAYASSSFIALEEELKLTTSTEKLAQTIEQLYAEELILLRNHSGLIPRQQQLENSLIKFYLKKMKALFKDQQHWYATLAKSRGIEPPLVLTEQELMTHQAAAFTYLTKQKITKALIAKELGFKPGQLHFIAQLQYHLDLFLMPGPAGSFFLVDYALVMDCCHCLLQQAPSLKLSTKDQRYLRTYRQTAAELSEELKEFLQLIKEQLLAAGFQVIPFPGHFFYEAEEIAASLFPMPSGGYTINSMNSLSGWSAKRQTAYFITHGMQVGDRLGILLMDLWTTYLQHYLPQIELYFIGRDPANLIKMEEAMDWWNRLDTFSGIHCLTFELT